MTDLSSILLDYYAWFRYIAERIIQQQIGIGCLDLLTFHMLLGRVWFWRKFFIAIVCRSVNRREHNVSLHAVGKGAGDLAENIGSNHKENIMYAAFDLLGKG